MRRIAARLWREITMVSLRCTGKLLKRLGIRKPGEPPEPTTALGDWYANVIYTPQGHYVLLVSERSLLPIVLSARDLGTLVPRFLRGLADVLQALGVEKRIIDLELAQMEPFAFAATRSRSVLGTMNDFTLDLRYMLPLEPTYSPLDWSLRCAYKPCGPLDMGQPEVVAPQILRARYGFRVIEGGAN
jgi:hypothetical protein